MFITIPYILLSELFIENFERVAPTQEAYYKKSYVYTSRLQMSKCYDGSSWFKT